MTREEIDFISGMNMCSEISNEAYKKIICHCEEMENCEDCISRKAAIDSLIGWETDPSDEDIESELRKLPSVNPQKWIPCKERLPEEYQRVMVTICKSGYYVDVLTYWSDSDIWKLYVVAWMPLPEPWKEGDAEC